MTEDLPDAGTLAALTLAQQHPLTRVWAGDESRLAALADDHDEDLMLAVDLSVARLRRDRFASGHPVELLLNRWLPVGDDLEAMLSMRYEGGDLRYPFVDASVLSRSVTTADFARLADAARFCFGVLGPLRLRIWSAEPAGRFPGTISDQRFLAAPLSDLRSNTSPPDLTLRPAVNLAHYDNARAAYRSVDRSHPNHPRQAAIQDRESLEQSRQAGLLFDVLLGQDWAGYAAILPKGMLGLPGFTVQELILAEHARGRGLGRHLSTLLARIAPDDEGVLIGTIHRDNLGSLGAASDAGRHDVGGSFYIPLR